MLIQAAIFAWMYDKAFAGAGSGLLSRTLRSGAVCAALSWSFTTLAVSAKCVMGQWKTQAGGIDREQSKGLLRVHADTAAARQSVQRVIEAYRKAFEQESVLWENARVCLAS